MYGTALVILWGLLLVFTLGWLLVTMPTPAPPAGPDPYAAEVARFRRELHDWDRH